MAKILQRPLLLATALGSVSYSIAAQPAPAPMIAHYQDQLTAYSHLISHWQMLGVCQLCIVAAVICFGATITIAQALDKGWSKPTTLVLGAAVTILSGVSAKVFDADYRVYAKAVIDGNELTDQMQTVLDGLQVPNADMSASQTQWLKLRTDFNGLQKSVLEGKNEQSSLILRSNTVLAQSNVPSWFSNPPVDDVNLYFKGVAEGSSLRDVGQQSFDSSVLTGSKTIATSDAQVGSFQKVIASAATIEKSYFSFDKRRGMYTYYTLLRISKDVQQLKLLDASPSARTIPIPATQEWTDTGISVLAGDKVAVNATGVIQWNYGNSVTPDGSLWKAKPNVFRPRYQVANIGAGGLIGKVGSSGAAFRVGKSYTFTAITSGNLYLGINDNSYKDNNGAFSASVTVAKP